MESLYLDTNASAPIHPEVLETWVRVVREVPANPASLHRPGRRAQGVLEEARERVAALLGCGPREILFTSGATESNNLALLGVARAQARLQGKPPALVASRAEHPAVLAPLRILQQEGHPLHLASIDRCARVKAKDLVVAAAEQRACLVTMQWANNETGTVQPLLELAEALPDEVHFHCDAVQGFGKLPYEPALLRAATFALSGHKFRAPKGIGVLRVREDAFLEPVISGGGQQRQLRPGTENAAGAASLAHALELAFQQQEGFVSGTRAACKKLLLRMKKDFPSLRLNSPAENEVCLPNTVNISFPGIDGRALLPACDVAGLAVSSGAACSSGSALPSAVLIAAGLLEEEARASLRISFGWGQDAATGEDAAERLCAVLARLYRHAKR